jgi:hypothetical protein
MNFRVLRQNPSGAHSPYHAVEQPAGRGVGWINRFLDREYVRRLADKSLYSYAHSLLHFVRWWESVHHTGEISRADLTESTLLDYVRFQSGRQPAPSASTINDRVATADRAIRNEFPDAPCQAGARLSSALPAPQTDGPEPSESGAKQTASEGAETQHRPALAAGLRRATRRRGSRPSLPRNAVPA